MGRAACCQKVGLKRGKWTAEEDEALVNYIQSNGEGSWRSLPKNAGLLRCGKSCRLRWINYLRGDLKRGNISAQEDETIVRLHEALGNRWSRIASHLPGRTDNEIKNYWNSHLSRQVYRFSTNKNKTQGSIDVATLVNQQRQRVSRVSRGISKNHHKNKVFNKNKSPSLSTTNKSIPSTAMDKRIEENVFQGDEFFNNINYVLESGDIDSSGISSIHVEELMEKWLEEINVGNVEKNERNVDEREDQNLSLDSSKTIAFCYDESEFNVEFGFGEFNMLDEDDMVVSLWENGNP